MAKQYTDQNEEDPQVHLKPVLGLTPAQYLPAVYTVIGLLILFIIFVVPGLRNNGAVSTFSTQPVGTAIFVDDQYACSAPCTAFVQKGDRSVRAEFPGFATMTTAETVPGRVIASWLFPQRASFSYRLDISSIDELLTRSAGEYASWAMVDRFFSTYRPEPVLTMGAVAASSSTDTVRSEYAQMIRTSALFAHEEILTRDLLRAHVAVNQGSAPLSAATYIDLLQNFIQLQSDYDNVGFWLYQTLRPPRIESLGKSDWFEGYISSYEGILADVQLETVSSTGAISVEGHQFIGLPAKKLVIGSGMAGTETHPYPTVIDEFFVLDREVSNGMYTRFIAEVQRWSPSERDTLVSDGLAEESYLAAFDDAGPMIPVTGVSFYAAQAYCRWLTGKLPASLSEYEVRLPTSSEWEYAARVFEQDDPVYKSSNIDGPLALDESSSNRSVYNLMGNVWEWCEDGYFPSGATLTDWEGRSSLSQEYRYEPIERIVRGGSWANTEKEIAAHTIGSQPPNWCTPVLGFRPVLARK